MPSHLGISQSKDSFYGEVEPDRQPIAEQLNARRKAWIAGGAVCSEMEAATVFVVSSILRKRAGGVMLIVGSHAEEHGMNSPIVALDRLISTGVEAIRLLIERDRRLTS
jgi:uridine phosphorylase